MKLEKFEIIEVWYNEKRRNRAPSNKTTEKFNDQTYIYKNAA